MTAQPGGQRVGAQGLGQPARQGAAHAAPAEPPGQEKVIDQVVPVEGGPRRPRRGRCPRRCRRRGGTSPGALRRRRSKYTERPAGRTSPSRSWTFRERSGARPPLRGRCFRADSRWARASGEAAPGAGGAPSDASPAGPALRQPGTGTAAPRRLAPPPSPRRAPGPGARPRAPRGPPTLLPRGRPRCIRGPTRSSPATASGRPGPSPGAGLRRGCADRRTPAG